MSKHKARREIPRFNHPIIETHCHLDYLEAEELERTLARSAEVGIVMTPTAQEANVRRNTQGCAIR